ncbi:hypothetical protein [Porphyromonas crevioricanis]|nr:hypothetical protein [Porphyromonas crevioricanis]SJZ87630.1 hypothetical protein SAMN02745203_01138 [Porphyromonas crevioricanis]
MKTRFAFSYLLVLAFLMIWQGCNQEELVRKGQENIETLSLQIRIGENNVVRAGTEPGDDALNENKVSSLQLAVYDNATHQLVWDVNCTSLFNAEQSRYMIPVPQDVQSKFDGSKTFNIHLLVNIEPASIPESENDLKHLLVEKSIEANILNDFVMYGSTAKNIDMSTLEGKVLGEVQVKRLASKLRVNLTSIGVDGYDLVDGSLEAKAHNIVTKAYLDAEEVPNTAEYKDSEYRPLAVGRKPHYYSYFSSWDNDNSLKPEVKIHARFKKQNNPSEEVDSYYTIPIDASDKKLKSNCIYEINTKIEVLGGSAEEEPVSIHGELSVKEWEKNEDEFGLPATEYLLVAEHNVTMSKIETYEVSYVTSKIPITAVIQDPHYSFVDKNGVEHHDPIPPENEMYPEVSFDGSKIKIKSKLPKNNVPKKFEVHVFNGVPGLMEKIVVIQFPAEYILFTWGEKSSWRPDGTLAPNLNNKAIYHIVSLIPSGEMILGFPPVETKTFYKKKGLISPTYDPKHTDPHITLSDEATKKMISPSFELASQLGATVRMKYKETHDNGYLVYYDSPQNSYALHVCASYTETRGGKVLDDWRLPTDAEIQLVDKLQNTPQGAVQSIMTGRYYWNASGTTTKIRNGTGNATTHQAHVRCVRDVKENM